jgi:TonB-dependent SusC/RagA subfamily outer membrane receptor
MIMRLLSIFFLLFSQISFSQDSTTIQDIDKKWFVQKLPAVLKRKELLQNINYSENSKPNGQPNQSKSNIRINCGCSKGGEPPLYIVDGKEMIGDLQYLDPQAIESISVLKDAASAKNYGDKGKNGVIIITMKKVL